MPPAPDKALVGLLLGEEQFVVAVDQLVDIVHDPLVHHSADGTVKCVISWHGVAVHTVDLAERLEIRRSASPAVAAIVSIGGRALGILASGATRVARTGRSDVVLDLRKLLAR
jgi:chemotaxis signal transduction protein